MPVEATLVYGAFPFISEGPSIQTAPAGQLDSATYELVTTENWEGEATALGFTENRPIAGFHSMWVESLSKVDEGDQLCTVQVTCSGLRKAGNKLKRTLSCAGRQVAIGPFERVILVWEDGEKGEEAGGGDVEKVRRRVPKLDEEGEVMYKSIGTPSGLNTRWNITEAILTVTDRYFSTSKLASNLGGTAQTPSNAPTPPPFQWSGYGEPMRGNHPNGWILADRQETPHFEIPGGQGLCEYQDAYEYYYPLTPE